MKYIKYLRSIIVGASLLLASCSNNIATNNMKIKNDKVLGVVVDNVAITKMTIRQLYHIHSYPTKDDNLIPASDDECLKTLVEYYKNICQKHINEPAWKLMCILNLPDDNLSTGKCSSGSAYRILSDEDGYPVFITAIRVNDKNFSNFDGSKWSKASINDIKIALKNNDRNTSVDPKNWYYVFVAD